MRRVPSTHNKKSFPEFTFLLSQNQRQAILPKSTTKMSSDAPVAFPGTNGVSVQSESESSSSGINWSNVIFFFLWILWVAVLVAIVGYSCREKGRREGARAVSRDVETPPNSDDGSGKTESRIIVLLPTLAAFIAFVLSIVPHTSCNFVRVNPWSSYDDHPFYSMGLWRAEFIYNSTARFGGEDECYSYRAYEEEVLDGDNYEMSTAIRMARASSILAILLGGMSLLVLLYAAFDHAQQIRWHLRKLCLPLFMATIFQALTFTFLLTNECQEGAYCNIHDGGLAAVTATMYWFLTGCGVSFLPPKPLVDQSPEK